MKTLVDYRHRAARLLWLYRWKYHYYTTDVSPIVHHVERHIFICYSQIRMLYDTGIISSDCLTRAYYMYAKIRNIYHRGINNGGIK